MLNEALRVQDVETIIKMGFFLCDLHRQINELQLNFAQQEWFNVYRGQTMTKNDFEKLRTNKGGLLSFNNFLSTSLDEKVARLFMEINAENPNIIGILFVMKINTTNSSVPFARIDNISFFRDEEEILFSMHTIFHINDINQIEKGLWQVDLTLTNGDDQQLKLLTEYMREELGGGTAWQQLSHLMYRMGQFEQGEEICKMLVDSASNRDNNEINILYHMLGLMKHQKGDYREALSFYLKVREIEEKNGLQNHANLATLHGNIGSVCKDMGQYSDAITNYNKALEIFQTSNPVNHAKLSTTYNNMGVVYRNMKNYSAAVSYYQKALDIKETILPFIYPEFTEVLINLGVVHGDMKDYSKSITYHKKALEISQKSLPSNHPNLANAHGSLGVAYFRIDDHSNALLHYQEARNIFEKISSNHPNLANIYQYIGAVYRARRDYSNARCFYEKSCVIRQQSQNQTNLIATYNDIAIVCSEMAQYPDSLRYYKLELEILQKSLPANHNDLAPLYNNIAGVYKNMKDYPSALSYYNKALEIIQESVSLNGTSLAYVYNNIGSLHDTMGDSVKALDYYQQALEILEKSLSPNDLKLAVIYHNIAEIHSRTKDY